MELYRRKLSDFPLIENMIILNRTYVRSFRKFFLFFDFSGYIFSFNNKEGILCQVRKLSPI